MEEKINQNEEMNTITMINMILENEETKGVQEVMTIMIRKGRENGVSPNIGLVIEANQEMNEEDRGVNGEDLNLGPNRLYLVEAKVERDQDQLHRRKVWIKREERKMELQLDVDGLGLRIR